MAEFFKTSTVWVVYFLYDGRARRWLKAFGSKADVRLRITAELQSLYGHRARVVDVRKATTEEETDYLRGRGPANVYCPTGR